MKIELCKDCAKKAAAAALEVLLDKATEPEPVKAAPVPRAATTHATVLSRTTVLPPEESARRALEAITAICRVQPSAHWIQVSDRAGLSKDQLRRAARDLIAKGLIVRVGKRSRYAPASTAVTAA